MNSTGNLVTHILAEQRYKTGTRWRRASSISNLSQEQGYSAPAQSNHLFLRGYY